MHVTGPMHREVANCCRYLAMVPYHAGDMAAAIMQQHKELIINERCLGLDHPDTARSYGNMALFYHGLNQSELALRHMFRALLLLSLSSGPDHPDVTATYINVAMMYQDIGKMNTALRYLQEALKNNERLLGEEHIQTAVCYHALAIAFNCVGAYKLSHQHEKKTYDIIVKHGKGPAQPAPKPICYGNCETFILNLIGPKGLEFAWYLLDYYIISNYLAMRRSYLGKIKVLGHQRR